MLADHGSKYCKPHVGLQVQKFAHHNCLVGIVCISQTAQAQRQSDIHNNVTSCMHHLLLNLRVHCVGPIKGDEWAFLARACSTSRRTEPQEVGQAASLICCVSYTASYCNSLQSHADYQEHRQARKLETHAQFVKRRITASSRCLAACMTKTQQSVIPCLQAGQE